MKRTTPLLLMALFGMMTLWTSVQGYRIAQREISNELTQALLMTQAEAPADWLSTDTVRQFRSHIPTVQLRDRASLSLYVGSEGSGQDGLCSRELRISPSVCARGYLTCSAWQVWRMSDQRLAFVLSFLTLLCMAFSLRPSRMTSYASSCMSSCASSCMSSYHDDKSTPLRLTPMQEQLVSLLLSAPGRSMSKHDICQSLWPGKPDANETLYTLVRRTKQALKAEGRLRIASERGRSYRIEQM